MSIDKLGGASRSQQADDARKAEAPKTKSFDSVYKKEKKDTEKAEKSKGDKKADESKRRSSEEQGAIDRLLGNPGMRERIEGGEGGGEGGGQGGQGEGGEGSPEMQQLEGEAKELVGAEATGKLLGGEKAEGGERAQAFDKMLSKKGGETQEVKKQDQAQDLESAKKMDKPGEAEAGKLSEKDDSKSLAEQLKAGLEVPGQAPHPFMMNQVQQAEAAQAAKPVLPPEIVDKIVQNARFGMNAEGAHEFQVDLKQDVYGGLKMKIATKDGKVTVNFIAENPEVAAQFEAKAADVAKQLTDRGLNVTTVNVMTRDQDAAQGQSKGKGAIGGVSGAGRAGRAAAPSLPPVDTSRRSGKDYTA